MRSWNHQPKHVIAKESVSWKHCWTTIINMITFIQHSSLNTPLSLSISRSLSLPWLSWWLLHDALEKRSPKWESHTKMSVTCNISVNGSIQLELKRSLGPCQGTMTIHSLCSRPRKKIKFSDWLFIHIHCLTVMSQSVGMGEIHLANLGPHLIRKKCCVMKSTLDVKKKQCELFDISNKIEKHQIIFK